MKNLMLKCSLILLLTGSLCYGQTSKSNSVNTASGNDIEVYYFHFTTRCTTCKTIEAETKKNIEMLYTDQVKKGKINFTSLNIEESAGKTMADRFGINSQTLLIVYGDKKINITNEGFLYAVSKPDKFREVIKEKIDPFIK